jgi:acetyl-CoA carboxylase biotin carboxylase subunit
MKTIRSILIANRGEIAARIIRTCQRLGIRSIAVYSDADRDAPYVKIADLALYLGPSPAAESYLRQDILIELAQSAGADAIHPGYGFLSENAGFAQKVIEAGLVFIGPNPSAIQAMGSKSQAKAIMAEHGVPVIPGYRGEDQSEAKLKEESLKIGFPLLLKAAAGGGGKGMRIVQQASELEAAIAGAKREAMSSFGDDELLIEKYFPSARHIEFQIFGDQTGKAIHLFERECSIQRRYQKIVEESPSPVLSETMRETMGQAAVAAARAIRYDNAGTVEFIWVKEGEFYFLEVNTRLQVEHPVTEAITGLDLVEWQILAAEGKALPLQQHEVKASGYAIECRLYAEDPARNFLPATGKIEKWNIPQVDGLRLDSAVETGAEVSIFYDPMIAKVITHAADRASAQRKMHNALSKLTCVGLTTNQAFLIRLLENPQFQAGDYDTHFIQNHLDPLAMSQPSEAVVEQALIASALNGWQQRETGRGLFKNLPSGWRNSFYQPQKEQYQLGQEKYDLAYRFENGQFKVDLGEKSFKVKLVNAAQGLIRAEINGQQQNWHIIEKGELCFVQVPGFGHLKVERLPRHPIPLSESAAGGYQSPMPGEVIMVLVKKGDLVKSGQSLLILSSMKMENTISANADGEVEEVFVESGQRIEGGFTLLNIQENTQN